MGNINPKVIEVGTFNLFNFTRSSGDSNSEGRGQKPFIQFPNPVPGFTDRQNDLETIQQFFKTKQRPCENFTERVFVIVGIGGMGKTELARKFASMFIQRAGVDWWRFDEKKRPRSVWWVRAGTENDLRADFVMLAKELGLAESSSGSYEAGLDKRIYRHIAEHAKDYGRVLFIFDNALALRSNGRVFGISDYLPTEWVPNGEYPFILVTSHTAAGWSGPNVHMHKIPPLSRQKSCEFLRFHFQLQPGECDKDLTNLSDALLGHPLTMSWALGLIDYDPQRGGKHQLNTKIQSFLDGLSRVDDSRLTHKMNSVITGSDYDYNHTMASVWKLALSRVEDAEGGVVALELLRILSLLKTGQRLDHITCYLMESVENDFPNNLLRSKEPGDSSLEELLKKPLFLLQNFFFVTVSKDCRVDIPRILQLVIRLEENFDFSALIEKIIRSYVKTGSVLGLELNLADRLAELLKQTWDNLSESAKAWLAFYVFLRQDSSLLKDENFNKLFGSAPLVPKLICMLACISRG